MEDLRQTFDYLGSLANLLRDLQGTDTLAYELIQNADDAPDVTEIVFRVTPDALIVSNNGVFRDVDFERLLKIARRGKRLEDDTTGAFGIGFVAVYQVTDRPTIRSAGRKWTIHPDQDGRIARDEDDTPGTVFELPWAKDPQSPLRQSLGIGAIEQSRIRSIEEGIAVALPAAALFLRKLKRLSLDGLTHNRVEITRAADRPDALRFTANGVDRVLPVWKSDFADEANMLRAKYVNLIEQKRSSDVSVALCAEAAAGRYYAYLPTNRPTGLPIHVQADFFPSQNRKDLPFGDDHAGEWNRAAVDCAAVLLGSRVLALRDALGSEGFWRLLFTAEQVETTDSRVFWLALHQAAQNAVVLPTIDGRWIRPRDGVLLKEAERFASLLAGLGLEAAHESVTQFNNLLEKHFAVHRLDLRRCLDAIERSLASGQPVWLSDDDLRGDLDQLLQQLARANVRDERLLTLAFVRRASGGFGSAGSIFSARDGLFEVLSGLGLAEKLSTEPPDRFALFLSNASAHLAELLALVPDETWRRGGAPVADLLTWLSGRTSLLDDQLKETIASLPLWPAGGDVHPLRLVVRPGDFDDPLGIANVLDMTLLRGCEPLLDALQVQTLTFAEYVETQIAQAFQGDTPPAPDQCRALRRLLAERLGEVRQVAGAQKILQVVPFLETASGEFLMAAELYLPGGPAEQLLERPSIVLVPDDGGASDDLFRWLGVEAAPSLPTLVDRVVQLVRDTRPSQGRPTVTLVLSYLCKEYGREVALPRDLEALTQTSWLPAEGDSDSWHRPADLFTSFRKSLFESTGRFLDLHASIQQEGSTLLRLLGVATTPPIGKVVAHLRNRIKQAKEVGQDVYQELGANCGKQEVRDLRNDRCVWVGGQQRYVLPSQAFFRPVTFGRFGVLLKVADERARAFFEAVGVRDQPAAEDGVRILGELSSQFGNLRLDDEAASVWHEAWRLIAAGADGEAGLEELFDRRVILAVDRRLLTASEVLIEDRAFVADRFGSRIRQFSVPPIQGPVGDAIERAGVRRLSAVVKTVPADVVDSLESADQTRRVRALAGLVARACSGYSCLKDPAGLVSNVEVRTAPRIRLVHQTDCFGPLWTTEPFDTAAWLEDEQLSIVSDSPDLAFAVARELSNVLVSNAEASSLAALISTIFERGDADAAGRALDQLGIPPSATTFHLPATSPATVFEEFEPTGSPTGDLDGIEVRCAAGTDLVNEPEVGQASHEGGTPGSEVGATDPGMTSQGELPQVGPPEPPLPHRPALPEDADNSEPGDSAAPPEVGHKVVAAGAGRAPRGRSERQRLRSYVLKRSRVEQEERPQQAVDDHLEVDRQGTEAVLAYERRRGWEPTKMDHRQKGYDIYSVSADGNDVRYIEVKSRRGRWDAQGVALSDAQYEFLRGKGVDGWLYVVENALSPAPLIHPICNPIEQIDQYFFDDGWRGVSSDLSDSGDEGTGGDDWLGRWIPP